MVKELHTKGLKVISVLRTRGNSDTAFEFQSLSPIESFFENILFFLKEKVGYTCFKKW